MTTGCAVVADASGVSPQSLEETGTLEGSAIDQSTETLKNGMVAVRVQEWLG